MYLKPLEIGNVKIENNIILAPMAGVTDKPFRRICKEYGPGLVYTEMASSRAIFYGDKKTKDLINLDNENRPITVQIFGSDVESMKVATEYVSQFADIIDINMGCPAPKIVKNGDGSKLLLDLDLVAKITETVVKNAKVPVTVKLRKGWDDENIVAVEAGKIIEQMGAKLITVHGRTRQEFYSGKVDLEIIKKVKESVKIPVIGNGDIFSEEDALKMFEYTGVDGIMCGRGTLGNPWIFRQIIHYLKYGEKLPKVSPKEKLEVIKKHYEMAMEMYGTNIGIKEMRKHLAWYVKNMKNSSRFKEEKINKLNKKEEIIEALEDFFNQAEL